MLYTRKEIEKLSTLAKRRIEILKEVLQIKLTPLEEEWEKISIKNGLISIADKLFHNLSDYTFSLEINQHGEVVGRGYAIGSFLWRYKPKETAEYWKELLTRGISNFTIVDKEKIKSFFYFDKITGTNLAIKGLGYGIRIYRNEEKELKAYIGINENVSENVAVKLKAVNIKNNNYELKEYFIKDPFLTEVRGKTKRIQINVELELNELTKDLLKSLKLPEGGEYIKILEQLREYKILLDTISYKSEHLVLYFC